jgi:cytoskeletal protein CcmA (bactofilin family)
MEAGTMVNTATKGKPRIGNLSITGNLDLVGGQYNKVNIIGEGTIAGDIECNRFKCVGTLDMDGHLKSTDIGVTGTISVAGGIQAESMKATGTVIAGGNVSVKKLRCSGSIESRGNLLSEEIALNGHLTTQGDCEVEVFKGRGIFTIGGMLNVGELDIKLYHNCLAKEIGAERINIRRAGLLNHLILFFKPSASATLSASIIEGDEIYLEHTKAQIVRGKHVTIGPGCEIELVEYKEHYAQVKSTTVKENRKV